MSIQGVALQVLESVHIIATTKNIDTLKGRYELLLERVATLRNAETNRLYSADINASIETYKSMYHDRMLTDLQLSAVSKPTQFNVRSFYCEALVSCTKRFVEEQSNEISGMKSENAKTRRKAKIMEKIQICKNELQSKCASTSSFAASLNSLETIQATIK
jgi:hypothetical protein